MQKKMTARKLAALLLALVMSIAFMPAMALATEDLPAETDDIEDVHTHGDDCDQAADVVALDTTEEFEGGITVYGLPDNYITCMETATPSSSKYGDNSWAENLKEIRYAGGLQGYCSGQYNVRSLFSNQVRAYASGANGQYKEAAINTGGGVEWSNPFGDPLKTANVFSPYRNLSNNTASFIAVIYIT